MRTLLAKRLLTFVVISGAILLVLFTCRAPEGQPVAAPASKLVVVPTGAPAGGQPQGPTLKQLAAGARDEGQVRVAWDGGLDDTWRQRFEDGLNREFGITVALAADPQQADVVMGSDLAVLAWQQQGQLAGQHWTQLFGTPAAAVRFDGQAVDFAQDVLRPAYSTHVQPGHTWDAILDGRFKGRLGVSAAADVWARLSSAWGPDQTQQFVKSLAQQRPVIGTDAQLAQALEQGRIDAIAAAPASWSDQASATVTSPDVDPAVVRPELVAVLKPAKHPDAAALFAGFLMTEEGQQLWRAYRNESSLYVASSPLSQYAGGRNLAVADEAFLAKELAPRTAAYGQLLGLPAASI
ncbi:MAG: substrate-binding domain-containing protein [Chloroflexi bacterium]|nr:substrate-binding domain-containing protein [Chloroflexota bacterium]